jgi:hypothetical protein
MNYLNVAETPTPALLAFYNAHSETPLKAFRSRAQAVERCTELVSQLEQDDDRVPEPPADNWLAAMDPADAEAASADQAELEEDTTPAPSGELASLVGNILAAPKEDGPEAEQPRTLTSLQTLCDELKVVPRIARRRLRKVYGTLGEGRWEFPADQIEAVSKVITGR